MTRALEVRGLTLDFAGLRALNGVDFTVEQGALVAIIGPNGAGKTSLFNCISGIYRPSAGSIRLGDAELVGRKPHAIAALGVARMFQNLALFDALTVLENLLVGSHHHCNASLLSNVLWLPAAMTEEVRNRRRAEETIEFLHLERFRDVPARVLPYGVRKRVELGRALCMQPRLLLLDEPAAGLNQEETEELARYLLDIKEELDTTQILIEHELPFVLDLASEVTVLDFGSAIASGSPDDIASDPVVVEAYIG